MVVVQMPSALRTKSVSPSRAAATSGPFSKAWGLGAAGPWVIVLCGAVYFALVAFGLGQIRGHDYLGADIYDAYYRAILQGRLDLPARLLQYEGHYTTDGTGYLYHGVGPLITRFALDGIWPAQLVPLGHASIWLWAVVGTLAFTLAFLALVRNFALAETARNRRWRLLFCAGFWLTSPGLLLCVNPSFYHEPIALAYALAGLFVLVYVNLACRVWPVWLGLPLLALCAAICVHARPNLAVGLYLGTAAAMGLALWRGSVRQVLTGGVVALVLLGMGGLGYLQLNQARFGAIGEVHGAFTDSAVQYGRVFWGKEAPDSPRAQAFTEHGRFNAGRVLPNLAMYLFYVPGLEGIAAWQVARYRAVTEHTLGYIRIERPSGMIIIWTGWMVLALWGLVSCLRYRMLVGLILGTGAAAGLTLAYGTITLRYSFDMWPFVALLGMMGALAVLRSLQVRPRPILMACLVGLFCLSTLTMLWRSANYAGAFIVTPAAIWSYEFCMAEGARTSVPPERLPAVCRDPEDHTS